MSRGAARPAFSFVPGVEGQGRIVFRGRDGRGVLDADALASLRVAIRAARGARLVRVEATLPGLFAAGADLRRLLELAPEEADALSEDGQRTFGMLARLPAVTIAIVDGAALGGGLDLALACDLRFATPRARLGHPGVKLGIVTGWGGTARLPRLIGLEAAKRVFYGGDPLDADEAWRVGLVDVVAEPRALAAIARRLARRAEGLTAILRLRQRARSATERRECLETAGARKRRSH